MCWLRPSAPQREQPARSASKAPLINIIILIKGHAARMLLETKPLGERGAADASVLILAQDHH